MMFAMTICLGVHTWEMNILTTSNCIYNYLIDNVGKQPCLIHLTWFGSP